MDLGQDALLWPGVCLDNLKLPQTGINLPWKLNPLHAQQGWKVLAQ